MRLSLLLALSVLSMVTTLANTAEIHVSPQGNDAQNGTSTQPVASPAAAQRLARKAIEKTAGRQPVTVWFHAGTYHLDQPLVFTAADSGTAQAPLVYAAVRGETVIFSGGRRVNNLTWQPYQGGIMQAHVPVDLSADQLFIDGVRQNLARYPNWQPYAPGVCFNGSAADAIAPARVATWADPTGAIVHAMHDAMWGDMSWMVLGKDAQNQLRLEGGWQNNRASSMHPQHRMIEGVFEELDAPGEWYFNAKTHVLYVYPTAGTNLTQATIESVQLKHLVEFNGSATAPVRQITLRGLTFRHTARTFMDNREPLLRSDWTIYRGGALFYNGAEDCAVEDCLIDQPGGNGVFVNGYNRRIAVRRCEIAGAGANAVAFVGLPTAVRSPLFQYDQTLAVDRLDLTPGPLTADYPADCVVEDCLLTRFADIEKQSTGVEISMAARISVKKCSIYDCPRAAINIGDGCWGGHLIEDCDIFDTVKETGDHGCFNSWGRDRFWVSSVAEINHRVASNPALPLLDCIETITLRHNRWRYDQDHGWDIDLDDGSSNYLIENNLCLSKGIKLREGFQRTVRNNICVNNSLHPHVWPERNGDVITHNIFMTGYGSIGMPEGQWGKEINHNFFTNPKDLAISQAGGRDLESAVGNPQFRDTAHGDFRVAAGSPALAVGFVNFPMDGFGVRSPRLRAKARTAVDEMKPALELEPAAKAEPTIAWFGATLKSVTTMGEVSATGLSGKTGVILSEVPPDSAAAHAGLSRMDVILAVNGRVVGNANDLRAALATSKQSGVTLRLRRNQVDIDVVAKDLPPLPGARAK